MESIPQKTLEIKGFLEVLRFNWKPTATQLLLAALGHGGPSSRQNWSIRSGIPISHLWEVIQELQLGGAIHVAACEEGMKILVQPIGFWRERQLCRRDVWSVAWAEAARQIRLDLVSEQPGLWEALADARTADVVSPERRDVTRDTGAMSVNNPVNPVNKSSPEIGEHPKSVWPPEIGVKNHPEFGCKSAVTDGPCTTRAGDVKRNDVSDKNVKTSNVGGDSVNNSALREAVSSFVGERDWERYWNRLPWREIFDDSRQADLLRRALRYCVAGVKEGIRMRKPGAALWHQFGVLQREELAK